MIRLVPDQSGQIERSDGVTFWFDDQPVTGHVGEPLAVALMRAGHLCLRKAPNDQSPRGAFCCMGLCQECAVRVQGEIVEGCRTLVQPDLRVERA